MCINETVAAGCVAPNWLFFPASTCASSTPRSHSADQTFWSSNNEVQKVEGQCIFLSLSLENGHILKLWRLITNFMVRTNHPASSHLTIGGKIMEKGSSSSWMILPATSGFRYSRSRDWRLHFWLLFCKFFKHFLKQDQDYLQVCFFLISAGAANWPIW